MEASATRHPVQWFALAVGLAYVFIAVLGFLATGLDGFVENGDDALLGFDLNPFHNVVHLAVGLIVIGAAVPRDAAITQGALIGGGLVLVVAAVLGFVDRLQLLSIDDASAGDNFLHLVSGALAIGGGLIGGDPSPQLRGAPAVGRPRFRCRDAGIVCDSEVTGESKQEVTQRAVDHVQREHGIEIGDSATFVRYIEDVVDDRPR